MLHFDRLPIFEKHQKTLAQLFPQQVLFFVGGCIRDVLLGNTMDPKDIDLTGSGDPESIRTNMQFNEKTHSRFRTEKFGTMTVIPKNDTKTNYEVTPFRTEGDYSDARHPDDIKRSDSIVADSWRRDFTINCLYSTHVGITPSQVNLTVTKEVRCKDSSVFHSALTKHGIIYLPNEHVLILQEHTIIKEICTEGNINHEQLIKQLAEAVSIDTSHITQEKTSPTSKEQEYNTLHILIDPHGGCQDLLQKKIRTVGDPHKRFTEDALRIIRAIRFPNLLNQYPSGGFVIDKKTWASMEQHAPLVEKIAKERIHQELVKVFKGNNPFGYIILLDKLGLIENFFPSLSACKNNKQPTVYHAFDTYTHTLLTLEALQKINNNYLAKLAMLYHDVGKPEQYAYITEQKKINPDKIDMSGYIHHTETGGAIAKKDLQTLAFSKKEIEEICWYIRWHHRPGEILDGKEKTVKKKIRALISEGGKDWTLNLLDVSIADRSGQFNPLQEAAINEIIALKEIVEQIYADEGRFTMKDLAVDGKILIQELSLSPGPELGGLLKKAFQWVLVDVPKRNTSKSILTHLKSL